MFNFKLESVLNYRKVIEEKKVAEFFERQKEFQREKGILESLQSEKMLILGQFKKVQKSKFNAADVFFYFSYVKTLNEKEIAQKDVVERLSEDLEKTRRELLATVKDRKIMDNLKERQFLEFKEDDKLRERRATDEMAIQAFVRNEK